MWARTWATTMTRPPCSEQCEHALARGQGLHGRRCGHSAHRGRELSLSLGAGFSRKVSLSLQPQGLQPHLALVDTSLVRRLHKPRPAIVINGWHDCVIHELIGAEVPPEPLNLRVVAILKDEDATCRHEIPQKRHTANVSRASCRSCHRDVKQQCKSKLSKFGVPSVVRVGVLV
jgi:hypothetical protein